MANSLDCAKSSWLWILSALIFHSNFTDQNEMANFMKNVAIAGGFLLLFVNGAGDWSLDERKTSSDR